MGKVDQGVFTHWMLSHYFRRDLTYLGYGGKGKQVRDLISIDDVVDLVEDQLVDPDRWAGFVGNVGGGREISLSLLETTELCRELTGNTLQIEGDSRTREGDVPIYLSDCNLLYGHTGWRPKRGPQQILEAIFLWIRDHERAVERARVKTKRRVHSNRHRLRRAHRVRVRSVPRRAGFRWSGLPRPSTTSAGAGRQLLNVRGDRAMRADRDAS